MRNFIIKFVPNDDAKGRVIHKVKMPDLNEKGFYQQITSFSAFQSGKRAGATKRDKEIYRHTCCWAPDGLYCCTEPDEEQWLKNNRRTVASLRKYGLNADDIDETKCKTVHHENIYAFYEYIGFDRKRRAYRSKP
jgi:hypothetical protein